MSKKCQHRNVRVGPDRAFSGPVSSRNEFPPAHGGVTHTETCIACGAERDVNVNGCHVEHGEWWRSVAEQPTEARRAHEHEYATALAARPAPRVVTCGMRSVTVAIDDEGYLLVTGAEHTPEEAEQAARASGLMDAARALRLARVRSDRRD